MKEQRDAVAGIENRTRVTVVGSENANHWTIASVYCPNTMQYHTERYLL